MPYHFQFEQDVVERLTRIEEQVSTMRSAPSLEPRIRKLEDRQVFIAGAGAFLFAVFGGLHWSSISKLLGL
jgi:hypothetical protein